MTSDEDNIKTTWRNLVSRVALITLGCLFFVLTLFGNAEIRNLYHINLALERLFQIRDIRSVPQDELLNATAELEAAIRYCPDDANSTQILAESQISLYRLAIYRNILLTPGLRLPEDEIWNSTHPISILASLRRLQQIESQSRIQFVRERSAVAQYLRPAFANLVRSRQSNPMSVGPHLLIAELIPILDKDDSQQEFVQNAIKRVTTVSPLSSEAWYETGLLEHNLGHTDNARAHWKQSLSLSRAFLQQIVDFTKQDMLGSNAQTLFRETFPNDPDLFLDLVTKHFTQRDTPDFYQASLEALKYSCETAIEITEGERHYYRGRYEMLVQQYESAIEELNNACLAQRTNHVWHYHLAQAYYANQQYKEAEQEIEWALFYAPGNKTYTKFLDIIKKAIITH